MSKTLKFGIVIFGILCVLLLGIIIVESVLKINVEGSAVQTEQEPPVDAKREDLVVAVETTLANAVDPLRGYSYQVDHIQYQDDGQMAMIWLAAVDSESGQLLGREPELALAILNENGVWQILLQGDQKFSETFMDFQYAEKSIQGDFLSDSEKMPKSNMVFGGYYLPWAANLEKALTWSVSHTSCTPTYYCTHAFDFADGTMFPILASKGGTVFHWKDTCANGDPYCTNSITLQDRSTTPWTYQIYLHLAKDSIPENLKQVGTPVLRGQYIGDVDDTGASTGHHVHFMVVTQDTVYQSNNGYTWGVAEDITFRDVDINWDPETQGGRPRLPYEAESYGGEGQRMYVSGNQPANPATGGITEPLKQTILTDPELTVTGWAVDDIAVTKIEVLANYDGGQWVQMAEITGENPFEIDVDLCNTQVPDGPFKMGLRVWDFEGNPSSILSVRDLIKDVTCGEPDAEPVIEFLPQEGNLAVPTNGYLDVDVTPGVGEDGENEILSVDVFINGRDWSQGEWMQLGSDTDGKDGWRVPVTTVMKGEASTYTVLARVTDSAGMSDVAIRQNGVVDHTKPQLTLDKISSPFAGDLVTLTWSGEDDLSGLDYYFYSMAVYRSGVGYQIWSGRLDESLSALQVPVNNYQFLVFKLYAHDKAGNISVDRIVIYTDN